MVTLADNKVRNDGFEWVRRSMEASVVAGSPPPPLRNAAKPWSVVVLVVSKGKDYWNENVRDIATSWMARGGRGSPYRQRSRWLTFIWVATGVGDSTR